MMKSIRSSLVVAVLAMAFAIPLEANGQAAATAPAPVVALSTAERAELLRQAQGAMAMIDDIDALMRLMPAEFFKLIEKPKFEQQAQTLMAQLKSLGFRMVKVDFGEPTASHQAGRQIICFLPNTTLMQIKGRLFKTEGYLLAVRPIDGNEWKFVDGAALNEHHDWLWLMFPELPRDIGFPAWKQEEVKS